MGQEAEHVSTVHDRTRQEESMGEIIGAIETLAKKPGDIRQCDVARYLGWKRGRISRIMRIEGVKISKILAEIAERGQE